MKRAVVKDEWTQALSEALGHRADTVPPGWINTEEFAAKIGKSTASASRDMRLLLKLGRAEKKKFKVMSSDGRLFPTPHYKLVK